jgi:hypothetical protein
MAGGLLRLLVYGYRMNIFNFEDFDFQWQTRIDYTINLYITLLIEGYDNMYNSKHVEFTINQIEKMLFATENYNINATDDSGDTYLHKVCSKTLHGYPFCVELFEYFLSKGLNPEDKNIAGKTCLDKMHKEHLEKALTAIDLFNCRGIGLK